MPSFNDLHPRGEGGRFIKKPTSVPSPAYAQAPEVAPVAPASSLKDAFTVLHPQPRVVSLHQVSGLTDKEATLPAGEYAIGDPGYMVPDDNWMTWLKDSGALDRFDNDDAYVAELPDGNVVVGFPTADGDGLFTVTHGDQVLDPSPVDAGMLGIAPMSIFPDGTVPRGIQKVTFNSPIHCRVDLSNSGHVVRFGDVSVVTMSPTATCVECGSDHDGDGLCSECELEALTCDTCGSYVADGPTDACSLCEPDTFSDSDY